MPPEVKTVHPAEHYELTNILLVAEAYQAGEEGHFDDIAKEVTENLFKIAPFNLCRDIVTVYSLFVPSVARGIGVDSTKNTSFGVYYNNSSGILDIAGDRWDLLADTVRGLTVISDAGENRSFKISGKQIWGDETSSSYGLVIVVANLGGVGEQNLPKNPDGTVIGGFYDPENRGLCNRLSDWWHERDLIPICIVAVDETFEGYQYLAYTIAHEVGHSLGLADEYERIGSDFEVYDGGEPNEPNVTAASQIEGGDGRVDVDRIKWKYLMAPKERDKIRDNPEEYVVKKPRPIPDVNRFGKYPDYKKRPMAIAEGGRYYRSGIYRSGLECIMRSNQITLRESSIVVEIGGSRRMDPRKVAFSEFCRVCRRRILYKLRGFKDYKLGRHDVDSLKDKFEKELMPRLALSFKRNYDIANERHNELFLHKYFCDNASARLGIMLTQLGIDVDVVMSTGHVSLVYGNIVIDPTFYQFYMKDGVDELPKYKKADGSEHTFEEEVLVKGFIGTFYDMINHFYDKRPFPGTTIIQDPYAVINELYFREDFINKLMGIYNDESVVRVSIDSDITQEEVGGEGSKIGGYWGVILMQQLVWADYYQKVESEEEIKKEIDCFLRPLNMKIPLKTVQEMDCGTP